MLPGTWFARGDEIHITNPDGSVEILSTSWERDRREAEAAERAVALARAEALKQHLAEKRAKPPERAPRGGRGH